MMSGWGYKEEFNFISCDSLKIKSAANIQDFIIKLSKTLQLERLEDCKIHSSPTLIRVLQLTDKATIVGHFFCETESINLIIISDSSVCGKNIDELFVSFFEK